MKDDTISRQAAIDALGERPVVWSDNDDYTLGERNQYDMDRLAIETVPSAQPGWIPVTERLPENEQDVFVTVEVRLYGKPFRRVVKAFYTDGRHTDADSAYSWDEFPDPQYDDDDNLIIPEGWWESSDYTDQQGMINDFVLAWQPLPTPYREGGQDESDD